MRHRGLLHLSHHGQRLTARATRLREKRVDVLLEGSELRWGSLGLGPLDRDELNQMVGAPLLRFLFFIDFRMVLQNFIFRFKVGLNVLFLENCLRRFYG